MAESFSATGAYRTCPVCGKEWFILELQIWGYKRTIRWNSGNTEKLLYFCGWSCMRQFDADPKSYIAAEKNKATAPNGYHQKPLSEQREEQNGPLPREKGSTAPTADTI
jgi:hypothetical protein